MKMCKFVITILIASLVAGSSLMGIYGEKETKKEIKIVVDGKEIEFKDAKPYIDKNSRTLVPLSFVAQSLGAETKWDSNTWKVTVEKDSTKVVLLIGSNRAELNGEKITLDTIPIIDKKRTMVPISFINQCFGGEISWDSKTSTVNIKQKKLEAPKN